MMISSLVRKTLTPLVYLTIGVMFLSGIFLAFKGHAGIVWPGVLFFVFSPFVFPFLMIPTAFFVGLMQSFPAAAFARKVMAACGVLYLCALLPLYASFLFHLSDPLSRGDFFAPAMTSTAAAAIAPWAFFAARDRANLFFTGLVLMHGAVVTVMCAMILFWRVDDMWILFFAGFSLMAAMTGLQSLYERFFMKKA